MNSKISKILPINKYVTRENLVEINNKLKGFSPLTKSESLGMKIDEIKYILSREYSKNTEIHEFLKKSETKLCKK